LLKGYQRMLQTKFGDHPSISSVEEVDKSFILVKRPLKGSNQINISKIDKRLPNNAQDKVW
jgi:hypothetical protein